MIKQMRYKYFAGIWYYKAIYNTTSGMWRGFVTGRNQIGKLHADPIFKGEEHKTRNMAMHECIHHIETELMKKVLWFPIIPIDKTTCQPAAAH